MDRRKFIKSTALAGLGTLCSTSPILARIQHHITATNGKAFDPSTEPKRVRKSFYDLTDEELRNFCRAVGYMRTGLPLEDPTQWDNYALIHALHCTEASDQHPPVHWSWNFLPWHRAYLYFLERILANILTTKFKVDGSKFALPYWDWTQHKGMPNTKARIDAGLPSPFFGYDLSKEDMVNKDGFDFDNGALFDGNRGPTLYKPDMNPDNELTQDSKEHVAECLHYMSKEYVSYMLAAPFEQFGGKPVTDRQTGQGLLEQGPHNDGHDWVGTRIGKNRDMGTLRTAAGDPMFFMHHGCIDHVWSLYTLPQPDPKGDWGKQVYNFLDVDGSTLTLSVQDIIEKTTNVTYAPSAVTIKPVPRPIRVIEPVTVPISTFIDTIPVTVNVPADFFEHFELLVDVQTGPITDTGKYAIKIYAGEKYLGKINWLDGEYRAKQNNKNMVHTFSTLLTDVPKSGSSITFVPPKDSNVKVLIKSITYRPL